MTTAEELARLGTATIYEAGGGRGLIDVSLRQIIPGSRAAGRARTIRCGQADNLMVHAAMAVVEPGDVLIVSMPEPEPVALLGDLLVVQAMARGAAAVLVDAAVRDIEELIALGLPIWARWVCVRGATKQVVGEIDVPIVVGGQSIEPGDVVVLDSDGAVAIPQGLADEVLTAALERVSHETRKREQLQAGLLSYDLDGLRQKVEGS